MNNQIKSRGALFINVPIPAQIQLPNGNRFSVYNALIDLRHIVFAQPISKKNIIDNDRVTALNNIDIMIESIGGSCNHG